MHIAAYDSSRGYVPSRIHHEEGFVSTTDRGWEYCYYKKDHVGNVRMLLRGSGTGFEERQRMSYYPFGTAHPGSYRNLHLNRRLFSGKELEDAALGSQGMVGWYDYGARLYNPRLGRWLGPDPARQVANPYLFCGNAPVFYRDPSGLSYTYDWNSGEYLNEKGEPTSWSEVAEWISRRWGSSLTTLYSSWGQILYRLTNSLASPYLDRMVGSPDMRTSITGLMLEFGTGFGPETRHFYENHVLTQSLKNSYMTQVALKAFWEKYTATGEALSFYQVKWGPVGLFFETGCVTELWYDRGFSAPQFLGTATYYFSVEEQMVNITVKDTKNKYSLLYHLPGVESHYRDQNPFFGTTFQYYHFSVPLEAIPQIIKR